MRNRKFKKCKNLVADFLYWEFGNKSYWIREDFNKNLKDKILEKLNLTKKIKLLINEFIFLDLHLIKEKKEIILYKKIKLKFPKRGVIDHFDLIPISQQLQHLNFKLNKLETIIEVFNQT